MVFVGQNPGFNEDRRNEPFVGRAGLKARGPTASYASSLNLFERATLYLTNIARCWTPSENPPTKRQYKTCRSLYLAPDLAQIFRLHSNRVVVALGAPAATHLHALCGHKEVSFATARAKPGRLLTLTLAQEQFTFPIFAVYHPSYLNRVPTLQAEVAEQLAAIGDWMNGITLSPSTPWMVPPFAPHEFPRISRCPRPTQNPSTPRSPSS